MNYARITHVLNDAMVTSALLATLGRFRALLFEIDTTTRPRLHWVLPGLLFPSAHEHGLPPCKLQVDTKLPRPFSTRSAGVLQPSHELAKAVAIGDDIDRPPIQRRIRVFFSNDIHSSEERE